MIKTSFGFFLIGLLAAETIDLRPTENVFAGALLTEEYITDKIDLTAEHAATVFKPLHDLAVSR